MLHKNVQYATQHNYLILIDYLSVKNVLQNVTQTRMHSVEGPAPVS